jgi:hypothetical protein
MPSCSIVDRRKDGRTDRHDETNSRFRNFSNELKSDKFPTRASKLTKSFLLFWEKGVTKCAGDGTCGVSTEVLLITPASWSMWRCVRLLV